MTAFFSTRPTTRNNELDAHSGARLEPKYSTTGAGLVGDFIRPSSDATRRRFLIVFAVYLRRSEDFYGY